MSSMLIRFAQKPCHPDVVGSTRHPTSTASTPQRDTNKFASSPKQHVSRTCVIVTLQSLHADTKDISDPHPLLQQLPLTVSPFLSLPTAVPLPYSYKQLPSTLPPSVTDPQPTSQSQSDDPQQQPPQQAQYVVSQSGHRAHPDQIIASCRDLQAHLRKLQDDARATIQKWDERIRERELAEKRRVAPGWLDVNQNERMLVPERRDVSSEHQHDGREAAGGNRQSVMHTGSGAERMDLDRRNENADGNDEGEELDRAFGGLGIR